MRDLLKQLGECFNFRCKIKLDFPVDLAYDEGVEHDDGEVRDELDEYEFGPGWQFNGIEKSPKNWPKNCPRVKLEAASRASSKKVKKGPRKSPQKFSQIIFMLLNCLPEDVVGDVGVVGAERAHDDAPLLAVVVELEEARHIVGHREEDCRVFNSPISNLNLRLGILI